MENDPMGGETVSQFNEEDFDENSNQELSNFDESFPDPLQHCVGFFYEVEAF